MSVNLANKYSNIVAERFAAQSLTEGAFCDDFEFTGVKTLKVYSIDTVPLGDYTRSGIKRYGTPGDLGDSIQELTMTQDKAFTFIIDKGDDSEQLGIKQAGKCLRRQIDERVTPYIDKYRFKKWVENAGTVKAVSEPTKETVVSMIMDGTATLDNALVPATGRKLFVRTSVYKLLKQADEFLATERIAEQALKRGVVGDIDGMEVIKVPDSWLPDSVYFLIAHPSACISPVKLQDYKLHKDPPGISGSLAEGRILFDAFVLESKQMGIYAAADSSSVCSAPVITPSSGESITAGTTTVSITADSGESIKYTLDGSDPKTSETAAEYSSEISSSGWSGEKTVRAYAYKAGSYDSAVVSATYEI